MISVVVPFHNEEDNLPLLRERIVKVLREAGVDFEIVFVNDCSTDRSSTVIDTNDGHSRVISLKRRMGKGEALAAGVRECAGDIIFFMDGDLEDDPAEMPRFLQELEKGCDLVNGVRTGRTHNFLIKTYSSLANQLVKKALRSPFTDINCGYKCMRKAVLDEIPLYGNNFRFFPLAAFYAGFAVSEIPVTHRKRAHGVSKFGSNKLFIGLIDTVTAYFLYRFAERPLHFFGSIGFWAGFAGSVILGYLGFERLVLQHEIYRRPLLFLGMLLVIVGVQVAATGFLGELIVYMHKRPRR